VRIFLSILSACGMTLRSVLPTQKRGSMGGGSDHNDDNAGGRGNPARIAALSTDRTLTAIIGCPHHHIGQEYAIFEPA